MVTNLKSVVFRDAVKVRGDLCKSLNATTEIGRLGARKNVVLELDDRGRFVGISVDGKMESLVPISNVLFCVPDEKQPAPAVTAKK